jgi:hypothetical protein
VNPDKEQLAQSISQLTQLISGVCENLLREMREGFAGVNERLDRIEAHLDSQNALMQTAVRGLRWPKA